MQSVLHFSDSTPLRWLHDMLTAFRMAVPAERALAQSPATRVAVPCTEKSEPAWQGQWRTIKYL